MTTAHMLPSTIKAYFSSKNTSGIVADKVYVKSSSSVPEAPLEGALVWVLESDTATLRWRGMSDAEGSYQALGLIAGGEYIVVGIDPTRSYKAVAAGPVIARWPAS